MNSNKATGQDRIPAEIYKALRLFIDIPVHGCRIIQIFATIAFQYILADTWFIDKMPEDFCDAFIVAFYKTNRSKSDCGKYRVFQCCPPQARFLPAFSSTNLSLSWKGTTQGYSVGLEQSTADMVFTMKQIHQKCIEQTNFFILSLLT